MKIYTNNILESGTLTVTGTADDGFPETRLYDRALSLLWKDTVTEAKAFTVDQGGSSLPVDFLSIEKHNFNGLDMQWQYSNDNFAADIHDAITDWAQTNNNQIVKTLTASITSRYWRVTISSKINPVCGELFMGTGTEYVVAQSGTPCMNDSDNVKWNRTVGGIERSTKFGEKRRVREYTIVVVSSVDFRDSMDELQGYRLPFYIQDTDGSFFLCRLKQPPVESPDKSNSLVKIAFDIVEML